MKTDVCSVCFAAAVFCCTAGLSLRGATFQEITRNMSPEEKSEYQRTLQERRQRRTGGTVMDRRKMSGRVVFLNAQNRIRAAEFAKIPERLAELFKRDIVLVEGKEPVGLAAIGKTAKDVDAECVIILTDAMDAPALLIAPEAGWASVNVAPLADEDGKKFARRIRRELMRAFGFLCGADSTNRGSVLEAVKSIDDLDELTGEALGQDAIIVIDKHLSAIGVKPYTECTYRTACEEGWAPEPTNDVQRAVWEQVHQIPKTPMKIKYDPKKGR